MNKTQHKQDDSDHANHLSKSVRHSKTLYLTVFCKHVAFFIKHFPTVESFICEWHINPTFSPLSARVPSLLIMGKDYAHSLPLSLKSSLSCA